MVIVDYVMKVGEKWLVVDLLWLVEVEGWLDYFDFWVCCVVLIGILLWICICNLKFVDLV